MLSSSWGRNRWQGGRLLAASLCAAFAVGAWATDASAQEVDQVIVVPFSQRNPQLPHPAHEGAHVTFKAMVRNATCGSGYRVWWDANRNGNFDDDPSRD